MKYVLATLALTGLLSLTACTESARGYVRLIGADMGNGSAVVLSPGVLLTAKHVAEAAPELFIEPQHIKVKVLRVSKDHDLALVSAPGVECPCVELAPYAPSIDDEVTIVGFPLNGTVKTQIVTKGTLQGILENSYVTTAPATFGNSGGGLFVNNKLVGILVTMAGQPVPSPFGTMGTPVNYLTMSINWQTIKDFIDGKA